MDYGLQLIACASLGELDKFKKFLSKVENNKGELDFVLTQCIREVSKKNNLEMIKYLISIGAELNLRTDGPVLSAIYGGYLNTVKYFFEECEIKTNLNHKDMFKLLLRNCSDSRKKDVFEYIANMCQDNQLLNEVMNDNNIDSDIRVIAESICDNRLLQKELNKPSNNKRLKV